MSLAARTPSAVAAAAPGNRRRTNTRRASLLCQASNTEGKQKTEKGPLGLGDVLGELLLACSEACGASLQPAAPECAHV